MDGWNTIVSFWDGLVSRAMLVSGSVLGREWLHNNFLPFHDIFWWNLPGIQGFAKWHPMAVRLQSPSCWVHYWHPIVALQASAWLRRLPFARWCHQTWRYVGCLGFIIKSPNPGPTNHHLGSIWDDVMTFRIKNDSSTGQKNAPNPKIAPRLFRLDGWGFAHQRNECRRELVVHRPGNLTRIDVRTFQPAPAASQSPVTKRFKPRLKDMHIATISLLWISSLYR